MKTTNTSQLAKKIRVKLFLITVLTFMLLVLGTKASAQRIHFIGFVEQNIIAVQKGVSITSAVGDRIQVGYFFQATHQLSFEQKQSNYPFHGLDLQFRVKNCNSLTLWGGLKTGLVNGQYLAVVPQLNTQVSLTRWLGLGINASYRAGHPALGTSVSFKL